MKGAKVENVQHVTHQEAARRSRTPFLTHELSVIVTLWKRDMLHLRRERSRWLGVVFQPLLFWLILGSGMSGAFRSASAPGVDYLTYFYPGTLVMILLFTTIFATISVIEDRQTGFLQGVLVAPGSRLSLVLGKTSGVTTLALLQAALFLVLAPLAGYPFLAIDWVSLTTVLLLSCGGLTAINLGVAWLLNSTQAYHGLMSVVLLPLWVLSGAMFPAGPSWTGIVMRFNPLTYSVTGVRAALAGSASGLSLGVLSALFGVGLLFSTWATARS